MSAAKTKKPRRVECRGLPVLPRLRRSPDPEIFRGNCLPNYETSPIGNPRSTNRQKTATTLTGHRRSRNDLVAFYLVRLNYGFPNAASKCSWIVRFLHLGRDDRELISAHSTSGPSRFVGPYSCAAHHSTVALPRNVYPRRCADPCLIAARRLIVFHHWSCHCSISFGEYARLLNRP